MQDAKIKLQAAFNNGFVPNDVKKVMRTNSHQGQVWVVENDDEERLGVGYKVVSADGQASKNYIHWYTVDQVRELLKEIA